MGALGYMLLAKSGAPKKAKPSTEAKTPEKKARWKKAYHKEVNNHLNNDWIDAEATFYAEMRTLSRIWGLPDPAGDVIALATAAAAETATATD